jgi:hypothetical protein
MRGFASDAFRLAFYLVSDFSTDKDSGNTRPT